ncbi:MAG: gamma-glutamyltransferase, partial [Bacteriovoracaceae bacterium]|nr:gamma-glutamyltransferase [Bacteriovoracaceae bacterium]
MFIKFSFLTILLFILGSCSGSKFTQENDDLRKAQLIPNKLKTNYQAFGKKYMIATQGGATTIAAKYALDKGGNIFDAATAASFAISVERPHSTGLGGGGFMLIHHADTSKDEAIDFREMAPRMSRKDMFLENGKQVVDRSLTGGLASGTPGLVAGVIDVHKKYGKLPLSVVMRPAILMAEKGFKVYPALEEAITEEKKRLCKFPSSRRIFLRKNCRPLKAGELLVQKDLANTLKLI